MSHEVSFYREDNGTYSSSEAQQDDVSGVYIQKESYTELKSLLVETKSILETSSAIIDTVWYDDLTTLCDKIELILEQANGN